MMRLSIAASLGLGLVVLSLVLGCAVDPAEGDPVPACAGEAFTGIYEATEPFLEAGTLPAAMATSSRSKIGEEIAGNERELEGMLHELVAGARFEVDLQIGGASMQSETGKVFVVALKALERTRRERGALLPVVARVLVEGDVALREVMEWMDLDERYVRVELGSRLGAGDAMTVVVDGKSALVGGVLFEGEVARSLLAEFDDAWPMPKAHRIGAGSMPDACHPILVVGRDRKDDREPVDLDNPQAKAFLAAIDGAQSHIRLRTPVLDEPAIEKELVRAIIANPELTVDVLLGAKTRTNEASVARLTETLATLGVKRVCERLRVRWQEPVAGAGRIRYASFDGRIAIVGTASLDTDSFRRWREVNVVVDDAAAVERWDERIFAPTFAAADPAVSCR